MGQSYGVSPKGANGRVPGGVSPTLVGVSRTSTSKAGQPRRILPRWALGPAPYTGAAHGRRALQGETGLSGDRQKRLEGDMNPHIACGRRQKDHQESPRHSPRQPSGMGPEPPAIALSVRGPTSTLSRTPKPPDQPAGLRRRGKSTAPARPQAKVPARRRAPAQEAGDWPPSLPGFVGQRRPTGLRWAHPEPRPSAPSASRRGLDTTPAGTGRDGRANTHTRKPNGSRKAETAEPKGPSEPAIRARRRRWGLGSDQRAARRPGYYNGHKVL